MGQRLHRGVYLGPCLRTSDSLVGTTEGTVVKARTFRRLPESQKAAAETVKRLRGVPWKPDGDLEEEWTRLRVAVPDLLVPKTELPQRVVDDIAARHVYIRRHVELRLKKFGFTARCPGCHAAERGGVSANHSAECRARIVRAMLADEELSKGVLDSARGREKSAAGRRGPGSGREKSHWGWLTCRPRGQQGRKRGRRSHGR
eukprot:6476834-Amphidinium_carterae.1